MKKRKWLERILIFICVMCGSWLGKCLYSGLPIWNAPAPEHVVSAVVSAYGSEYGEAANHTKTTGELTDREQIRWACGMLNDLHYVPFSGNSVFVEPRVSITYMMDDGSIREIWAGFNEFQWNGKAHAIIDKESGRFVDYAMTLFHLEAQE